MTEGVTTNEEDIFLKNINLVKKVMAEIHCRYKYDTYNDCFQEGCMGLLAAIRNYDRTIGEFSTYAYKTIKCCILSYYCSSMLIKPTQKVKIISHKFRANQDKLTFEEMKDFLSCQEEDIQQLDACCNVQSLDFNDKLFIPDLSVDEEYKYTDTVISVIKTLNKIISEIPQKTKHTKRINYKKLYKEYIYDCIFNGKAKPMEVYAKKYNVSKQRIQVVIRDFKKKFKEYYY